MVEPAASAARDAIRVFVSYDREHDEDLHQRFVSQALGGHPKAAIDGHLKSGQRGGRPGR